MARSANPSNWLSLALVVLTSLTVLAIDYRTRLMMPVRAGLSVVVTPVHWVAQVPVRVSRAIDGMLSTDENETLAYDRLYQEYSNLKAELLRMRSLESENASLRELLQASARLPDSVEMAELLEVGLEPYRHRVVINRGISSGVYVGQPVIDSEGVMGQVTDVMPMQSVVMLITDLGHAIPVRVERSGLRTVAYGSGSSDELRIPYMTQNSDVRVGDTLLSSGLGGRFPEGYPVAVVQQIQVVTGEAFLSVTAKPVARVDKARHVLLLSSGSASEVVE
jgi:rod shape-determining protein MreC